MTDKELLTFVKNSLRVVTSTFDVEINALIDAAKTDITQATNDEFDITDSVQCNAVAVYCQAYFGYGDEKAINRYQQMLQMIGLRHIKEPGT